MLKSNDNRKPRARTVEVDALRGFALFGIVVVNVPFLAGVDFLVPPAALADRIVNFGIEVLFQGKFFVLFSFLFGWGFSIQLTAAEGAGRNFMAEYLRRLLGLFMFGLAHTLLVFNGDILVLYALMGLLLMTLRKLAPRRLLTIAAWLIALEFLALMALAIILSEPLQDYGVAAGYLGGFVDAARQRAAEWPLAFGFILLFNGPSALAAFCAGLAAAKTNFFEPGASSYIALKRRWPWLLSIGVALNLGYALAVDGELGDGTLSLLAFAALAVAGPCLASVYLLAVVELARRDRFAGSLAAGRMSLTAYIAEGVLAGLIFNGYGLGYYGQVGVLVCTLVAIAIYSLVHAFARLWLKRQRYGPLEYLLRLMTRGFA